MAVITAPWQWYLPGLKALMNKEIDLDSDNIVITAHTSSYTPNRATHDYVNDLTNEVATGAGYTSGGKTLTSPTLAVIDGSSATAAATTTDYVVGDVRRPASANGFVYQCVGGGTSGGSAPTWPTVVGTTVTDGTVVWVCAGVGFIRFDAADVSWSSSTFVYRYLVLSDRTPGTTATQPLLGILDAGSTQTLSGGSLDVTFDNAGVLLIFA